MSVIFIVLGVVIVVVIIGLVAVAVTRNSDGDPIADRLGNYIDGDQATANLEEIEMSIPFSQRVLLPIMQQVASFTTRFAPQEALKDTQHKIELAGSPEGVTPPILWTLRFVGLIVMGLLLIFIGSTKSPLYTVLGGLIGAGMGFMLPQMWLSGKITQRQDDIIKGLPDALDLMSICVEAGLGFDQAMAKVNEKWDNELALAFGRVLREITLGKTRRDALRAMDRNIGVADVTSFCSAIIQADQLGVSISRVLKIQSEAMRVKRRQRAQEKAQAAPIKMMIPMVLLIFPCIWLVLMGPAAVQLFIAFYPG